MFSSLPPSVLYLIALTASLCISLYSVKKIIFITRKRKIFDIPDNVRKFHGAQIPSLGGIGIFIGFIATVPFFVHHEVEGWNFVVISATILFFTGIYDDIMNMRPSKKLLAQFIASAVTVYFADLRIVSLYGILGIQEIPYWLSVGLTTFLCTFFINVFNFIDGIDGLACMISMLCTGILGGLFAVYGGTAQACMAFCLTGATGGLLFYNYAPAEIYMGDTGSMVNGFCIWVLAILWLRRFDDFTLPAGTIVHSAASGMLIAAAIIFPPIFDALRVFAIRASKGISPLKADRRHLHYYLLDSGRSHAATAWLLVAVNLTTVIIAVVLQDAPPLLVLGCITVPSFITAVVASRLRRNSLVA